MKPKLFALALIFCFALSGKALAVALQKEYKKVANKIHIH